jgi:hypothetical protein
LRDAQADFRKYLLGNFPSVLSIKFSLLTLGLCGRLWSESWLLDGSGAIHSRRAHPSQKHEGLGTPTFAATKGCATRRLTFLAFYAALEAPLFHGGVSRWRE